MFPGGDIQAALDAAAVDSVHKTVRVHAGTYRPERYNQAFIWLNARHDGITLEAVGDVTLTAANPDRAEEGGEGYPAMVNHVVYFGDGIGPDTTLRGFRITGANDYVTTRENEENPVQPDIEAPRLGKDLFFYSDGGGIKIFGRSYPTIERCVIVDNYSSPCGAGISVEHRGYTRDAVRIRDCVLENNRVPVTGAAIDLLQGSSAILENCLFVGNLSNGPMEDARSQKMGSGNRNTVRGR